ARRLIVTVPPAPEDPRSADLRRNVPAKLERALPKVAIRFAGSRQTMVGSSGDERYGEIEYSYDGRQATSRSTSHREVLPLLYGLAGVNIPAPAPSDDYLGYPLVASSEASVPWFFGALPLLIVAAWGFSRGPPQRTRSNR